jgi:RimJ/RimL family protein N-acetyltransferase
MKPSSGHDTKIEHAGWVGMRRCPGYPTPPLGTAPVLTARLNVRLPTEADRTRFVGLFRDADFMVFSSGVLDEEAAHRRFDRMLLNATELSFAKQPVIERTSGLIVGYAGVDWFDFEGQCRLEFGYRFVPEARGRGYATEASRAVLARAAESFNGEILAIIDPTNHASQNVARKLGFAFWKQAMIQGYLDNLYRVQLNPVVSAPLTPRQVR